MILQNLKTARLQKGYTLTELAARAGMTERNLSKIEAGRGTTLSTGKRLAKALNLKLNDLSEAA